MFDLGNASPEERWASRPSALLALGTCVVTELDSSVTSPPAKQQLTSAPPPQHPTLKVEFTDGDAKGLILTTSSILGTGGFGTVYSARSPSGAPFALKVSSKPLSDADLARLKDEVRVMTAFADHKNVVRIHCAALCGNKAYIAMERCMAKNLNDLLVSRPLHTDEFKWVGFQLVSTIADMHRCHYIHRDIKPQNLLFDKDGNVKITDFGLSSKLADDGAPRKTVAGTQLFMAPEMALHFRKTLEARSRGDQLREKLAYGAEIDVWSLGIVFFIMATRKSPYQHHRSSADDGAEWTQKIINVIAEGDWKWPESAGTIDPIVRNLIEGILTRDRSRRPSVEAILRHPVWSDRPLVCPLTLMASLSLLRDYQSPPSKLRAIAHNTPPPFEKRSVYQVVAAGLAKIADAEAATRADIEMDWTTFFAALDKVETLCREQQLLRDEIAATEVAARFRITASFRGSRPGPPGSRGRSGPLARESSVPLITSNASKPADPTTASFGHIIDASPDKIGIFYEGRDSATKWNLRSIVSIPRDVVEYSLTDKCLNNHVLRKLSSIPKGYEAFDCDICGSTLRTLSESHAILRCSRCDYDVCTTCAETPEANRRRAKFFCKTCNKRFLTAAKLHTHSDNCRGPSSSPARSSSEHHRTVTDVLFSSPRVSDSTVRGSARPSNGRPSTGGRISLGSSVGSAEDIPEFSPRRRPSRSSFLRTTRLSDLEGIGQPSGFELPDEALLLPSVPKVGRTVRLVDETPSPSSRARRALPDPSPKKTGDNSASRVGGPGGARSASRVGGPGGARSETRVGGPGGGLSENRSVSQQRMHVEIHSTAADKLVDVGHSRSARSPKSKGRSSTPRAAVALPGQQRVINERVSAQRAEPLAEPTSARARSKRSLSDSGVAAVQQQRGQPIGGPQRHHHSSTSPVLASDSGGERSMATRPPVAASSLKGPLAPPVTVPPPRGSAEFARPYAFLGLPRDEAQRSQFISQLLSGGWVRHYAFASNDVSALYYCLQPGRFGALFMGPAKAVMATVVVDINSSMVLYASDLSGDARRIDSHPHVATAFSDTLEIISSGTASQHPIVGPVLRGITKYIAETRRLATAGEPAIYITAPYVHQKNSDSVPHNTRFVYLRKAFPDPDGHFCMFRLSNLRSQIILPATPDLDIRWQSDARGTMGARYYVYANGTADPFVTDRTGTLTRVENVLMTVYAAP